MDAELRDLQKRYREYRYGGCICSAINPPKSNGKWKIDPKCRYHQLAKAFPCDHSIPWNCPTYWDGCNCEEARVTFKADKAALEAKVKRYEQALEEIANEETSTKGWAFIELARDALYGDKLKDN